MLLVFLCKSFASKIVQFAQKSRTLTSYPQSYPHYPQKVIHKTKFFSNEKLAKI